MSKLSNHIWVLAGSAVGSNGVGSAMLLRNGSEGYIASWQQSTSETNLMEAALLAVVEGMRQAMGRHAEKVTVLCASSDLVARLNRITPTAWDDPLARLWIQARALSHAFPTCEFRVAEGAVIHGAIELAAEVASGGKLVRAA